MLSNQLLKWEHDPHTLFKHFEQSIKPFFNSALTGEPFFALSPHSSSSPRVQETKELFRLSFDIPGINPKNLQVHFEDGVLSLNTKNTTGENTEPHKTKTFHARVSLPNTVSKEGIRANCEYGVLTVILPKKQKSAKTYIPIHSEKNLHFMEKVKKGLRIGKDKKDS